MSKAVFTASSSSPASADFSASTSAWTESLTSAGSLSSLSLMSFSIEYESVSAWLRTSADSRRFLSSAACSSASRTMRVAQKLYEGVPVNGETVGLITYMRTDGVQMDESAYAAIRRVAEARFDLDGVVDPAGEGVEEPSYVRLDVAWRAFVK